MVKAITKKRIEAKIAAKLKLNKTEASRNLAAVIESVQEALTSGSSVQLTGFGKFSTSETKARIMKSFGGKKVKIPAGKRVLFKAGKELKEAVK